jgi:hypothetical protein
MILFGRKQYEVTVRVDGRELKVAYDGPLTDESAVAAYVVNATRISATTRNNPNPDVELVEAAKGDGSLEALPPAMQPH